MLGYDGEIRKRERGGREGQREGKKMKTASKAEESLTLDRSWLLAVFTLAVTLTFSFPRGFPAFRISALKPLPLQPKVPQVTMT